MFVHLILNITYITKQYAQHLPFASWPDLSHPPRQPIVSHSMLGRKIIQVYPDENTSLSAPNQTGLPVRKLKSAGLRIVTAENMNSSDTLQVRASTVVIAV